jgi:anti-sigma28 factor (negative regulator of flagellin synthesis)
MKVEGNLLNISMSPNGRVQEPPKPASRSSAPLPASSQTAGDGVDLGSQSGLVAAAQSVGQADASSTVQRLRALVQSGQYQVDTAALSQSIVAAAGDGY